MYSEKIFQNALEYIQEGIKVNGRFVNNIRYADDTVIIANSQEGLQNLINAITREGDAFGLKINTEKNENNGNFQKFKYEHQYNYIQQTNRTGGQI